MYPLPKNLLSFLGAEHENELVSTHKHARDLDILSHIDGLIRAPIQYLNVPKDQSVIAKLYLFIHYHLYSTISNLMRLHVAEALGCERKAIDAALSAYAMLTDPSSIAGYEAREWKFLSIKRFIEKSRKKNPTVYPLADELIKTWDMCSEFGAHADDNAFALRLDNVPAGNNPDEQKLYFLYFQAPKSPNEARLYYVDAFATFLTFTHIFEPFIKAHATGLPFKDWAGQRDQIEGVVRNELASLHAALENPVKEISPESS